MAKVTLKLDNRKNRIKKDGTYPVVLFLSHGTTTYRIGLRYSFFPENWDDQTKTVSGIPNHKLITGKLQSQLAQAELYLLTHKLEVESMTIKELSARIQTEIFATGSVDRKLKDQYLSKKLNSQSMLRFADKKLERLRLSNKNGYAGAIKAALDALKRFSGREETDLLFAEIDLTFLKDFVAYCMGRGNKPNTISSYLRPVKTLFKEAIQEGAIPATLNPFPQFKIPKATNTKKRALRIEAIQAIRELQLKEKSALWDARNYFLFMFNNMGINLIDIARLRANQIREAVYSKGKLVSGRLDYTRSKNGRNYSIKLTAESISILNGYDIKSKNPNDLLFPIGFAESESGFATYKKKRQRINGRIRKLGQMIGVNENITSYYARHSWATIAKRKMIPVTVIAEGLGHSDLRTTQIYLDAFDSDVLDDANEDIVG